MYSEIKLRNILEDLCGVKAALSINDEKEMEIEKLIDEQGVDFNQFNEILLLFGFSRIDPHCTDFFYYLAHGKLPPVNSDTEEKTTIKSLDNFRINIGKYLTLALMHYGNIEFAYYGFSKTPINIKEAIQHPKDEYEFIHRERPVSDLEPIAPELTYMLGEFKRQSIKEDYLSDNSNLIKKKIYDVCETVNQIGYKNYKSYLSFDHLDVYIATSMRENHEYIAVHNTAKKIFSQDAINKLNLRWFDPTQASCSGNIDKGLIEALMLKRAVCTIYLVQESDTLGKDSELASTLAQGKPVIAFIPECDENYFNYFLKELELAYPTEEPKKRIINQIRLTAYKKIMKNPDLIEYVKYDTNKSVEELKKFLFEEVKFLYDERANKLKNHPLSLQVKLDNGVANGLLLVRNEKDCAALVKSIILQTMDFEIKIETKDNGDRYFYLYETISNSIFRVITGDKMLTNSFWNFYIVPEN